MNKTVPSHLYYRLALEMFFVKTAVEKGNYKKAIEWASEALVGVEKYQEQEDKSVNEITEETLKLVENSNG